MASSDTTNGGTRASYQTVWGLVIGLMVAIILLIAVSCVCLSQMWRFKKKYILTERELEECRSNDPSTVKIAGVNSAPVVLTRSRTYRANPRSRASSGIDLSSATLFSVPENSPEVSANAGDVSAEKPNDHWV